MKSQMFILSIAALLSLNMNSCKSSSTSSGGEILSELEQMTTSKIIVFQAEKALPLLTNDVMNLNNALLSQRGDSPAQILLNGSNYLMLNGESTMADLPFFGEVRMADYGYGRNTNIAFDTVAEDIKVSNQKNKRIVVTYDVKAENESYDVMLEIFPNKSANLVINAVRRTQMRYKGYVSFHDSMEDIKSAQPE